MSIWKVAEYYNLKRLQYIVIFMESLIIEYCVQVIAKLCKQNTILHLPYNESSTHNQCSFEIHVQNYYHQLLY